MKEPNIFKDRLKESRTKKGFTLESLANEINIRLDKKYTASTVGNWEGSVSNPSLEVLIEISKILEVSIDYLLGGLPQASTGNQVREPQETYNNKLREENLKLMYKCEAFLEAFRAIGEGQSYGQRQKVLS